MVLSEERRREGGGKPEGSQQRRGAMKGKSTARRTRTVGKLREMELMATGGLMTETQRVSSNSRCVPQSVWLCLSASSREFWLRQFDQR